MASQSHEQLTSFREVKAGSERKFGVTVGLCFCLLAVVPVLRHSGPARLWLLVLGALLLILGLVAPRVLAPANRLWFQLGMLLARITNPIVMGLMFFGAVVPVGWLVRRRGHDALRLKPDHATADSYWIRREAAPSSLEKQY